MESISLDVRLSLTVPQDTLVTQNYHNYSPNLGVFFHVGRTL